MLYLILCSIGQIVELNVIGRLMISEILLASALPIMLAQHRSSRSGQFARHFFILAGLWFVSAIATDLIRHTPYDDLTRGWAKIGFFIINFASISLLISGSRRRAIAFICLLYIAAAIRLRIDIDGSGLGSDFLGTGWKFGYGQLVTAAIFLVSAALVSSRVTKLAGRLLPFLTAAFTLSQNARNLFGLTVLSALAFAFSAGRRRAQSPAIFALICVGGLVAGWAATSAYSYAADSGLMGIEAKQKYDVQTSGDLGVILGGRTELLSSTQAIADSPIIGHGSWARDIRYVEEMVTRLERAGYLIEGDPFADDLIPSHSHLLGAWVEAGVLGAAFWVWAGWVAVRGLWAAITRPTPLTGFIVFVGLSLLWDILFSPFGLERRVITPAWLVLMMIVATESDDNVNAVVRGRVIQDLSGLS